MILNKFKEAKPWLCFLFLYCFCSGVSSAQDPVEYYGVVISSLDNTPIPDVVISLASTKIKLAETDSLGRFYITSLAPIDSVQLVKPNYDFVTVYLKPNTTASARQQIRLTLTPVLIKAPSIFDQIGDQYQIGTIELLPALVERNYMQSPLGSTVFPVTAIGQKELESTNQFSLQDALNQVPGVKMDSRGYNGSRRLNLRGTLTRSPFGVRNVRMLMNGFPITSSDGSSALELLEPADVSEINIYKGPTGSYLLPGTGGLLALQLREQQHAHSEVQLGAGELGGELGMSRAYGSVGFSKRKFKATLSGVYSNNTGYRTHEANNKAQLTFNSKYTVTNNLSYSLLAMLYDGYWELPGHINLEQVNEDPSQSNAYSKEHDASVSRRRAYVGLSQQWRLNNKFSNTTMVFSHITDKVNPYGNNDFFQGYKEEAAQEFGGRTEFRYFLGDSYEWTFKAGGQIQYFRTDLQEYENDFGQKGDLKYDNETFITEGLLFGSVDWRPTEKLEAIAQLGYNMYGVDNTGVDNLGTDLAFDIDRTKLLPRVGVSYKLFNPFTKVNLSYAHGMAFPSVFEWVDTETGLFNPELDPEESVNVELGFNTQLLKQKIDFSASIYVAQVAGTITERETVEGATFFENAGESLQRGIDIQSSYNLKRKDKTYTFYVNAALTDYQFENDTSDLLLRIPGIVPLTLASGLRFGGEKLQADLHARFLSAVPTVIGEELNSETDYMLLNAKINYEVLEYRRISISMHAGVNNLLNATYSSFLRLNWQRGDIFNPMPQRNYYVGITMKRGRG